MNFFSDHDVYGQTIKFLRSHGHHVIRAQDVGLAGAKDSEILRYAAHHDLILLTRDKDFGALVFQRQAHSKGIIFLRIYPRTIEAVHQQLLSLLNNFTETELHQYFVVIEDNHYRMRLLP